jgi:hypothetical protein
MVHKFADNNGRLIRWTLRLYKFDFSVEYTYFKTSSNFQKNKYRL